MVHHMIVEDFRGNFVRLPVLFVISGVYYPLT